MSNIIDTIELFPKINAKLIELLKRLTPEEWNKETVLPGRTVKDLASHLFDTDIRRLSMQRDGHYVEHPEIKSYQDLVDFGRVKFEVRQMNISFHKRFPSGF